VKNPVILHLNFTRVTIGMKIYRNTIGIILFVWICNILLRALPVQIPFSQEDYQGEPSFLPAPFLYGDAEHSFSYSSQTANGNNITYYKNKSQNGVSFHSHFCNLLYKNSNTPHLLILSFSSKTLLRFFTSSWYQVFGLKKIII